MIKRLSVVFAALFSIILFSSCVQDPASVPSSLIPGDDKVDFSKFDSFESDIKQSSDYYEKLENLSGSNKRILGKNEYAKSSILYSWSIYIPDSIMTYIKNGEVIVTSSRVTMAQSFHLGDTNGVFDYSVHKVVSNWNMNTLNRDSLKYINWDAADLASNKNKTDSTYSFNINNNLVLDWLKLESDSNYSQKNYGIIITPTENTNYFVGFNATYLTSTVPQTQMSIVLEKPSAGWADTLDVIPYKDLHVVEHTKSTPVSDTKIYLEAGYALRGNVFFDISSLPKNVGISKAILKLTEDTENTTNGIPGSDSILVHVLGDSTLKTLNADSSSYVLLTRSDNVFSGDITWMVQKWVAGVDNQGMDLALFDEYSSVSRIAIYGSKEQNKALRPRLIIYYSKKI